MTILSAYHDLYTTYCNDFVVISDGSARCPASLHTLGSTESRISYTKIFFFVSLPNLSLKRKHEKDPVTFENIDRRQIFTTGQRQLIRKWAQHIFKHLLSSLIRKCIAPYFTNISEVFTSRKSFHSLHNYINQLIQLGPTIYYSPTTVKW